MSLILDALRKSEAERRRGQLPALTLELPPAPVQRRASRAWWLLLPLAAALAVGAYLASRWLDATPAHGSDAGPGQFVLPQAEPASVPAPADPLPAPADVVVAAPVAAPVPVPVRVPSPRAPAPATGPAEPDESPSVPGGAVPPVLALSDLSPAERQALPPLKLSMHMWSPDAARRFAIIDGQRVAEGDRVGSAVVERIETDGVTLATDGRRVRLPLP